MGSTHEGRDGAPNLCIVQGGHLACRGTLPLITMKAVAQSLRAAPGTQNSMCPVTYPVLCFGCILLRTISSSHPRSADKTSCQCSPS